MKIFKSKKIIRLGFLFAIITVFLVTSCKFNANGKHTTHTYSDEWSKDETYHWHAATCGHSSEIDKALHLMGEWTIKVPATEDKEGVEKRICDVCGFEETRTVIKHIHDYDEHFYCKDCGDVKILTVSEFLSAIGNEVTDITYDSTKPGITKSDDGKIVNISKLKISGDFGSANHFPSTLVNANLKGLDTSLVTNMRYMFYKCSNLKAIDLSNFDTSNVTDMFRMFSYCSNLETIDVNNFDTSNVTDMGQMFQYCSNLETIDLSSFDTSNVDDMSCMFFYCENLKTLNVSNFETPKVRYMNWMFSGCVNLETIDLSSFNTSNVKNMDLMFDGCYKLTYIDLSNFDTSKVGSMTQMFYKCSSLTYLDLSNFDTSKVTDMSWMFCGCTNLETIDLSSFDTSNVTTMSLMFSDCSNLETIFASDSFVVTNVVDEDDNDNMFYRCRNLKGAIEFNGSYDKSYANCTTGYFTLKQ